MICSAVILLGVLLSAPEPPVTRVKMIHGVPALFINGEHHPGTSYMTYHPESRNFRAMGEVGVHLYSFSATPTESTYDLAGIVWLGSDEFDYSGFEERVNMLLESDPDAVFFPRLYLGTPPWWADEHPDDLVQYDPGDGAPQTLLVNRKRVASWASEQWRKDTVAALHRFIRHVEASEYAGHVIGYHLASGTTEEWMQWGSNEDHWADYSPVNQAKFRAWLKDEYLADEALRAAWANPDVTLDSATVPPRAERARRERVFLRDPRTAQPSIDYTRYTSWLVADTIQHIARAVKEEVRGERLVGVFYGYLLQLAGQQREQNSGHHALQAVLSCPDIDFITSPTSYSGRDLGTGYVHAMSLVDSVKLHGKLWFDENDFRTWLAKRVPPNFPGYTDTFEKTVLAQRRSFAWTFTNRLGMWWFDMGGGWYDDPRLLAEIGKMNRIAFENRDADGHSVAEIAFVVDDSTGAFLTHSNPFSWQALVAQLHELGHVGAPIAIVHVSDLDRLPSYRLYVFANLLAPREEDRLRVARKLEAGGSALWIGPAGLYRNGKLDPAGMKSLTGFPVRLVNSPAAWRVVPTAESASIGWKPASPYVSAGKVGLFPSVEEGFGTVLGAIEDTGHAGLVMREEEGQPHFYSSIPKIPADLLRAMARKVGIHLYSSHLDVVWACGDLLSITVKEGGDRIIRLPKFRRIVDLWTGETVSEQTSEFEFSLSSEDTALFRLY